MNKVMLIGRLTKDGELRTTKDDVKLYSNSIAVNRRFKNSKGEYETDFFNFTLWNIGDNFAKYLTKGKLVMLEGRLQTRKFEDENKKTRYLTDVIAEKIELLGGTKEDKQEDVEIPTNIKSAYDDTKIKIEDKDLPF